MNQADKQQSYIAFDELLAFHVDRCQQAAQDFHQSSQSIEQTEPPEFGKLFELQSRLIGMLKSYHNNFPDELLNTRVQYTHSKANHPAPQTTQQAIQQMAQVNEDVVDELRDLGEKLPMPGVKEQLTQSAHQIAEFNRQISLVLVTAEDI